jgi:hypothetical protein
MHERQRGLMRGMEGREDGRKREWRKKGRKNRMEDGWKEGRMVGSPCFWRRLSSV